MRLHAFACSWPCGLLLTACSVEGDAVAMRQDVVTNASMRPDAALDAGRRSDAGRLVFEGAIPRDDADQVGNYGVDSGFPTCNEPNCVGDGEPCTRDSDCCQPGRWEDQRLCLGLCGYLVPGFDPVWHDPIPVCSSDAGTPSR